eukprot:1136591-Pelagomonas_calceolata.AAC.2
MALGTSKPMHLLFPKKRKTTQAVKKSPHHVRAEAPCIPFPNFFLKRKKKEVNGDQIASSNPCRISVMIVERSPARAFSRACLVEGTHGSSKPMHLLFLN